MKLHRVQSPDIDALDRDWDGLETEGQCTPTRPASVSTGCFSWADASEEDGELDELVTVSSEAPSKEKDEIKPVQRPPGTWLVTVSSEAPSRKDEIKLVKWPPGKSNLKLRNKPLKSPASLSSASSCSSEGYVTATDDAKSTYSSCSEIGEISFTKGSNDLQLPQGLTTGLPSIGAAGHVDRTCKPCMFHSSSIGCYEGEMCGFCHYSLDGKAEGRPRPSKAKRDRYQKLIASIEARLRRLKGEGSWASSSQGSEASESSQES